jgi:large subunit ribosomal protein L13
MSQSIIQATKTTRAVKKDFQRPVYLIDASKAPLGRIANLAAMLLMGKNRPDYQPDVDMGAVVVVINAKKLVVTGEKMERKNYFRHSGYPGGLKTRSLKEQMDLDATVPLYKAIRGMLPSNKLRSPRINQRLQIFTTDRHNLTQQMIAAN